jgi:serine/threonine protein kinase
VILYETITGQRAFKKATSADTMAALLNEDPPAVSQFVPNVPAGLQRIVQRCLSKTPEQRFQHASDMAFALEALSDSGSTIVRPLMEESRTSTRKKRLWAPLMALVVLVLGAIVASTSPSPALYYRECEWC